MSNKNTYWKKGRGKLGVLQPLIGSWKASTDSPMGIIACTRIFTPILNNQYIQLTAKWELPAKTYEEVAIIGIDDNKITFWSFTSDGKKSVGDEADGTAINPDAICFEAQMPAGLARMIYWPDENDGFFWAVESKVKSGWNRCTEHHYKKILQNSVND